MSRMVHCKKLDKELEGLPFPPFPNALGNRIFEEISKEAWEMWLGQQTILINELRLSTLDPEAQDKLNHEMQTFLFGESTDDQK